MTKISKYLPPYENVNCRPTSFFVACSTVLATILDSLLISVVLYVADECILI